jgi:hypothetical protein
MFRHFQTGSVGAELPDLADWDGPWKETGMELNSYMEIMMIGSIFLLKRACYMGFDARSD